MFVKLSDCTKAAEHAPVLPGASGTLQAYFHKDEQPYHIHGNKNYPVYSSQFLSKPEHRGENADSCHGKQQGYGLSEVYMYGLDDCRNTAH